MELKELKKKNEKGLNQLLGEYRDKVRDLRFKDANKQLKNIREIRSMRKIIAQIMTLLNCQQSASKITDKQKQDSI